MNTFPPNITFKYSWRKYQQRVLDELQSRLDDKHLHIVAPPGSGKTVLGLEVALRLNKPTLILAPTIAIRNQWIQRFCELFLQTTQKPEWITTDICHPAFLTVSTYQGLHAACNNGADDENNCATAKTAKSDLKSIVQNCQTQGIEVIIVDEAHHLKNEWWRTLDKLKSALNPIIVGLTATPPYDVTASEWQRYIELNGAIDAEISVPELVAEGDLCPHQDYAYITFPSEKEHRLITDFRQNIDTLFHEISADSTLCEAIENHPVWLNPTQHLEWIYTNLAVYSSMLIFLKFNQKEIQKTHLTVIGDKHFNVPPLDYEWMETLLRFYLYKETEFAEHYQTHREHLIHRLRRYGVIEQRELNFRYNRKITGMLTSSISKLDAIQEIVNFEYSNLKQTTRMVILADFIRKEFLVNAPENTMELNRIGVIPIFEKLRRQNPEEMKIGVLTGSVIILPRVAFPQLQQIAAIENIPEIAYTTLPFASDYVFIHQTEQTKSALVYLITQLFQEGEIEVLIGTKSLLGEGWDEEVERVSFWK